ncbi:MAG: AI-2E family transporter [candidate division KSB1 bacterium]|nr:AI-2E family transporter [candidate division KSB1 bacterium]
MENRSVSALFYTAAIVIIIAGMKAASGIIVRFLLALLLSFVFSPIFFRLNRLGLPEWLSMLLVFVIITLFGIGLTVGIGSSITDFSESLPIYQENLQNMLDNTITFLHDIGIQASEEQMLKIFDPNVIMNLLGNLLKSLTGMLSDSVLILLMVIFMLLEAYSVPLKVKQIWGEESQLLGDINLFVLGMQRYLFLKTLISLATGFFVWLGLVLIGVDFALLWGLIAFLLNFIPTIGSIIAAVPPLILSLFQMGWLPFLEVSALYLAVNNVIGSFLEPRIMGKDLNLSTFVVFFCVIFWGWVLGPVGMLLAVPLTMSVKMILERKPTTRWMAHMLANAPAKPKRNIKTTA